MGQCEPVLGVVRSNRLFPLTVRRKLLCFPRGSQPPHRHLSLFLEYPEAAYTPNHLSPSATFKLIIKNHKEGKDDFVKGAPQHAHACVGGLYGAFPQSPIRMQGLGLGDDDQVQQRRTLPLPRPFSPNPAESNHTFVSNQVQTPPHALTARCSIARIGTGFGTLAAPVPPSCAERLRRGAATRPLLSPPATCPAAVGPPVRWTGASARCSR